MIHHLQTCDDVDEALALYEKANDLIKECNAQIDFANGRFEEISRQAYKNIPENIPENDKKIA